MRDVSRKERRKAERRQRAERRHDFQQRRNKVQQVDVGIEPNRTEKAKVPKKRTGDRLRTATDEAKSFERDASRERRRRQRQRVDDDEHEVQQLEKKLGLHKRRKAGRDTLPKVYAAEGLDYVLNACGGLDASGLAPDADDASDVASSAGGRATATAAGDKRDDLLSDSDSASAFGDATGSGSTVQPQLGKRALDSAAPGEDIYGKPLASAEEQGCAPAAALVPPNASQSQSASGADNSSLVKLARRLVNRLSEQTMVSSVAQVGQMYDSNSHNAVKQQVSSAMLSSLCVPYRLPARLLCEMAMFVAMMHSCVQTELSSFMVEETAYRWKELLENRSDANDQSATNVAIMFCRLLDFQVVQAKLVLDIVDQLLERFTGDDLQLIIVILGECGIAMRKQDAVRVKAFIEKAQKKAATSTASRGISEMETGKIKFLQESLLAVKNNNAMRLPVSPVDGALLEHFQKSLRGLLKGRSREPAAMFGLCDVLSARTDGRWWIVGAAWRSQSRAHQGGESATAAGGGSAAPRHGASDERLRQFDQATLDLARRARMNTDLRRLVFCILVTANGADAAFERLLALNIRGKQEREIINITIVCCLREKTFNHYYVQVIERLCNHDKRFQLTTQFALWDRIRTVVNLPVAQRRNLATFISHVLLKQLLPINVLRCVDFAALDAATSRLLRRVLVAVLKTADRSALGRLFSAVGGGGGGGTSAAKRAFADSLRIYLQHVMRRLCRNHPPLIDKLDYVDSLWTAH